MAKRKQKETGRYEIAYSGGVPLDSERLRLNLYEGMSQSVDRTRTGPPFQIQRRDSLERIRLQRLVQTQGVRQDEQLQRRGVYLPKVRNVKLSVGESGTRSVCSIRYQRRKTLFSIGVAGRNRRKSPGAGGTYKRTHESYFTCRRKRR